VLGQIVFQSLRDGNSEIYVMYENGSNQVNLTNNPASDTTPTWLPRRTILGEPEDTEIPGGTMIGFSSNRDGERDIYVMDAVVTDPEIPPENTTDTNLSEESWPAWSPDGTQTTFDLVNGLGRDIWVMDFVTDPDGSNPQGLNRTNLSNDPDSGNTISSWKPDGTKIAFAALRDTDFEIYVINSDGSELTNLTNNSASDNAPSWSPDGTRIAFWSDRGSNRDIYVMNADGSGLARLTDDPGRDTSPTWSPDGKKIAFRSQRDGDSEIYVMDFVTDSDGFNPRGENLKNLTENSASDTNPRWSPLP
jgi:Tol biopolymer transport system component